MNPSRFDKWPIPRHTRHVWVYGRAKYVLPVQGYVLRWRRRGRRWEALVLTVPDGGEPVTGWVPDRNLYAVRSDPNDGGPWNRELY